MITDYVRLKGLFVDYRDTFNMAFFLLKNPPKTPSNNMQQVLTI